MLTGKIFFTVKEAKVIILLWRKEYNFQRPYSAFHYRLPAPETVLMSQLAAQLLTARPETITDRLDRFMGAGQRAR